MKKRYETAEVQFFLFEKPDVIVASGADDIIINSTVDSDETEIL